MPELLRLEHFGFTYPQQPRPALADVSLTVRQGEFWVLCGASGCGKTTLLRQLKPALRPHGHRLCTAIPGGADRHRQGLA